MRRSQCALLTAVAVFGFASVASAADMPVKAPIYKAPPVAVFNWTGCYVGAHVGYGWNHATDTDNPNSDYALGNPIDIDGNGFLGGGQIGCDYQLQSNFVIGIQGDLSATGIEGSTLVSFAPFGIPSTVNTHSKTDWIGTLTGRLGYSMDRSLFYVKGGVAWAHDKYSGDVNVGIFVNETVNATDTRTGWILGGGFEHAFDKNWSASIEYNYMDFGTRTETFPLVTPIVAGTFYIGDIDQRIQTVKFGINYRFGR